MADVKWIKIVTDIFDDEKMILIESLPEADSIVVCWFKLLCLAGKQNNDGVLMLNERIAYTDEMLATVFRRPVQTVRLALKTFEEFGMVEIINGAITIPNWGKHQNLDGIDKVREQTRKRVKEYRERQKLLTESSNVTGTVTVTDCNGIEEDKNKNKNKNKSESVFIPPTVEEIRAYCDEKGYSIDVDFFFNYYNSAQWTRKDGTPVLNWKQTVVTWAKKDQEKSKDQDKPKKNKVTTAAEYTPPNNTIDKGLLDKIKAAGL